MRLLGKDLLNLKYNKGKLIGLKKGPKSKMKNSILIYEFYKEFVGVFKSKKKILVFPIIIVLCLVV